MSRYVRWGTSILHRDILDAPVARIAGSCPVCGGLGTVAVPLDNDRYDAAGPCPRCQFYCPTCKDWRKREGHTCAEVKP